MFKQNVFVKRVLRIINKLPFFASQTLLPTKEWED